MVGWFEAAITAVAAYAIGSLPFGLIVGRLAGGIDIRRQGSGNIGATNVARVVGAKWGAIVLALDCLKGALPTALLPRLVVGPDETWRPHLEVIAGVAAIVGHMFPCWIGFRGGKGVATALGVVLVLSPIATGVAAAVFAALFAASRIVSLSSIGAASAFCAFQLWRMRPAPFDRANWSLAAFSIIVPLLIVARHRTNIVRLARGTEPRFRFGEPKPPGEIDTTQIGGTDGGKHDLDATNRKAT